jgi:hypothetical protein
MASAVRVDMTDGLENMSRARHMRVAEITEMIHVHILGILFHLTLENLHDFNALSSPLHLRYQALFMMMFWTMLILGVAWAH